MSNHNPFGLLNKALATGPPSPLKPGLAFPAMVVMMPLVILRILLLLLSEK